MTCSLCGLEYERLSRHLIFVCPAARPGKHAGHYLCPCGEDLGHRDELEKLTLPMPKSENGRHFNDHMEPDKTVEDHLLRRLCAE